VDLRVPAERVLQFLGLLTDLGYIGLHPDVITGYKRKRGGKTTVAGGVHRDGEPGSVRVDAWHGFGGGDHHGAQRSVEGKQRPHLLLDPDRVSGT
jgi:hypothetical protein